MPRSPLKIDAALAKSRFSFASNVKLPPTLRDITLALNLRSERIDHLNPLLGLDLPPLGPVSLESGLKVNKTGYDLSKLNIRAGDSCLDGRMKLSAQQPRPKLHISLLSESIQLDDFGRDKPDQTAEQVPQANEDYAPQQEKKKGDLPDADGKSLLSYEVLSAFDADQGRGARRQIRKRQTRLGSHAD